MSESHIQDPVLTDDEKEALLSGVENGDVEVQASGGPKYAVVTDFEVSPRNRIVTNSFPRLQTINRKLATYISKAGSLLLNEKVELASGVLTASTWGEFCEQSTEAALIFEFSLKPLEGTALIYVQQNVVSHIVESFYGGSKENPQRHEAESFTPGEMSVTSLFCEQIISGIAETWQGMIALETERMGLHQSTDIVEIIESGANIISTEFEINFEGEQSYVHIVWPVATLSLVLPILEGQKRDRDPLEDSRWEKIIRSRLPDARVDISTCVGRTRMSLREVSELAAGDIIDIDNPRHGTVFADDVALFEGRFGVHDGCYAIETTRWLSSGHELAASQT